MTCGAALAASGYLPVRDGAGLPGAALRLADGKVWTVPVPWAEKGSRFTALFERLAVPGATKQSGEEGELGGDQHRPGRITGVAQWQIQYQNLSVLDRLLESNSPLPLRAENHLHGASLEHLRYPAEIRQNAAAGAVRYRIPFGKQCSQRFAARPRELLEKTFERTFGLFDRIPHATEQLRGHPHQALQQNQILRGKDAARVVQIPFHEQRSLLLRRPGKVMPRQKGGDIGRRRLLLLTVTSLECVFEERIQPRDQSPDWLPGMSRRTLRGIRSDSCGTALRSRERQVSNLIRCRCQ